MKMLIRNYDKYYLFWSGGYKTQPQDAAVLEI